MPISPLTLCYLGLEVELSVLRSAAGYFIGAADPEDGSVLSRDSREYYPTFEEAERALRTLSFTQRLHP
jgi:hypothetical protein